MNRLLLALVSSACLLALQVERLVAADPDVASPLVSYQFLDSMAEPSAQPNIVSPLASYQYFEWPNREDLTAHSSTLVSFKFEPVSIGHVSLRPSPSAPAAVVLAFSVPTEFGTTYVVVFKNTLTAAWKVLHTFVGDGHLKTFLQEIKRDALSVFFGVGTEHQKLGRFSYPIGPPFQELGTLLTNGDDGDGWRVDQGFGMPNPNANNRLHLGEDWNAENGKDLGVKVYAAAKGTVVYARDLGLDTGWGGVIIIRHDAPPGTLFQLPNGQTATIVWSAYCHLEGARITEWVDEGQRSGVEGQAPVGVIGPEPKGSDSPHLHFEVRTAAPDASYPPGHGYGDETTGWVSPSDFIRLNK